MSWRLVARSGITTAQALELVRQVRPMPAEIAVAVLGVNDVIDQVSAARRAQRAALADWLRQAAGVRHVVFAPLPPVHRFPLLPQPLRHVMGADARAHDEAVARWATTRDDVSRADRTRTRPRAHGADGFHPGEPVYRATGEALARHITTLDHTGDRIMTLKGKTLFITGASRGIGLAIALRAAADGANIVIAAKDRRDQSQAAGTIHSAAAEIEAAGGTRWRCRPTSATRPTCSPRWAGNGGARFGGIDILVNNASAISLTPTDATPMKRFDLMFGVSVRGTYLCTQACLPQLIASARAGRNPHVLNMSPPLSMREHWFAPHVAYTMAKYGMSECTLGHAGEFRKFGIAVNSLPRTAIATAALQMIPGVDVGKCRTPEILADAAWHILTSDARPPPATSSSTTRCWCSTA